MSAKSCGGAGLVLAALLGISAECAAWSPQAIGLEGNTPIATIATGALLAKVPLVVIVGDGKQLCNAIVDRVDTPTDIEGLRTFVQRSVPAYQLLAEDGVAVLEPSDVDPSTAELLKLVIPTFLTTRPSELPAVNMYLWRYVQGELHPEHGSAYNILSSSDAEKLPPMSFNGRSVFELLRLIVKQGGGAVALVHRVPPDFKATYNPHSLIDLYSYHDDPGSIKNLSCQ